MTPKDYKLLANALQRAFLWGAHNDEQQRGVRVAATYVADVLQQDNSRFNRDKFMEACGMFTKESV